MRPARDSSTNRNTEGQALNAERATPITVVVVDDHPVFRQGISEILNSQNDIKVVAEAANGDITSYNCEQDIRQAASAGAKGFLVKVADPEQIREAIRRVAEGGSFFPPEIGLKLVESMSNPALSKRETQVLQQLACGKSNKEIGGALYISEGTVKFHVKSVLRKLNAIGRAEAIAIAVRRGLLRVH